MTRRTYKQIHASVLANMLKRVAPGDEVGAIRARKKAPVMALEIMHVESALAARGMLKT
jgi:hypothetical protein